MKQIPANNVLKIFSNCIPVRGICKAIICDLQNRRYYNIPISLFELINALESIPTDKILAKNNKGNRKIILEYIEFLIKNELAFFVKQEAANCFPKLIFEFETPSIITNAIFDYSLVSSKYLEKFIAELKLMGCNYLQLRFFDGFSGLEWKTINELISANTDLYFELIINKAKGISYSKWKKLLNDLHNISRIEIFGVSKKREDFIDIEGQRVLCVFKTSNISHLSCGFVKQSSFSIHPLHFFESQKFNTCLNQKISIDKKGEIRNCPSQNRSFGNIKEKTLLDVLNNVEFKKLWTIKKDNINVCKKCEFRYICTDCRAFVQEPTDIYSKPLKCGYDPKTGEWVEWSASPLSKNAIKFYGMQEMVK